MIGSVRRRHHSLLLGSAGTAITATGSDDTRTVLAIVALLAVIGIGLVMLAMWLFRVTRPDRELLAPLEVMGDRTWRRGDPVWQRRRLDEVRPAAAAPFRPSSAPPAMDSSYDAGPTAPGFADLSDADPLVVVGDPVVGEEPDQRHAIEMSPDDPAEVDDETVVTSAASSELDAAPDAELIGYSEGALIDTDGDDDASAGADNASESAVDGPAHADDTIDSGISLEEPGSLSDDVSSTPRSGVPRDEFVAASPSADPDATLADLVAAADEPLSSGDGSQDLGRSGE